MATFEIHQTEKSRRSATDLNNPGFGQVFADHMLEVRFQEGAWQQPVIKPYGPIDIVPALNTLHYGQSVFEGTKAYYVDEETVNLFRPEKNYERMILSCQRLCIPEISQDVFLEGIEKLIKLDHQWIPQQEGSAFYIRPFACAWDPFIAARIADEYRFYIITSPVGAYYSRPVRLLTSKNYVRAVQGGTGEAKTAGNYARSFYPAQKANEMGFDQVLWLDAFEHRYIEEVGTMNIFFLINDTLITPPLSGTILPGITRNSILKLAEKWGQAVEEREITIDEVMDASDNGTLQEVFGSGTAAVISPVECIRHDNRTATLNTGDGRGPMGQKIYETIYGMQTGKIEDLFGWVQPVNIG